MEEQKNLPGGTSNNDAMEYRPTAPLAVRIVVVLIGLSGLGEIIRGIPFIVIFGIGLIPIIFGALSINFAFGAYRLHRAGFMGTMVLQVLSAVISVALIIASTTTGRTYGIISLVTALLFIGILYSYRERFIYR